MDHIINEGSLKNAQSMLARNNLLIIKFTAEWCGPCKGIKPLCDEFVKIKPSTIIYHEIDIDESLELYMKFKKMKMLKGIPAIMAFYPKEIDLDLWYIPDDSVLEGDKTKVNEFFNRCLAYVNSQPNMQDFSNMSIAE